MPRSDSASVSARELSAIRKRLRDYIEQTYGSIAAFERKQNLKRTTVRSWLRKEKGRLPEFGMLYRLASDGLSLDWLFLNQGAMKAGTAVTDKGKLLQHLRTPLQLAAGANDIEEAQAFEGLLKRLKPDGMLALAARGIQPDYDAVVAGLRGLFRFNMLGTWLQTVIARDEASRARRERTAADDVHDSEQRETLARDIERKLGDLFPEPFRPNTDAGTANWAVLELIARELHEAVAAAGGMPVIVAIDAPIVSGDPSPSTPSDPPIQAGIASGVTSGGAALAGRPRMGNTRRDRRVPPER